jgi:hypothetical protein
MLGTEHPEDSQSVSKNEADQSMELASAPEESGSDADTPANGGAKGSANGKTRKAAGRGSSLHADKPRRLPDQLRRRYSNTEFAFTKAGEKGQDVKVKGGIHPSKYRNSDWPPDVDHADFKPDTPGGRRTFKRDQATKWPEKTKMLPYNPATGKLK